MKYARIENNKICSTSSTQDAEHTVLVPSNAECGWIASGDTWVDPDAESKRIESIKSEAGRRITERYPAWKQANMTARFCELLAKYELTASESEEKNNLLAVWAWVKQVRAESDRLEGIAGATKDDGNWPA
jgi:hypothetical protein